ncbi:MAG: multicopper oxidase family protein [Saccharofermentanales bacterium]
MKEMIKPDKKVTLLILALIVSVLAFGAIVFLLASSLYLPRVRNADQNNGQNGNALKIPALLQDQNPDPNIADFILDAQSNQTNFIGSQLTKTLGYNGSYLGPVLRIRKGEKVNIRVNNQLSFPTTIHWHGLVVDGEQDGGPHQGIQSGGSWSPTFIVDQAAATLWFHPHLMGDTADQVYYGLAGLIYIDDEVSDRLNLPKDYGINDIPLIVQDRSFNSDGSFAYQTSMMGVVAGNTILINGTVSPYINVNKGNVRFRILNASNSQNFEFSLSDGSNFQQIASDGGFLEVPLTRQSIFLAPGERAEVIVDFSKIKRSAVSLMLGNQSIMTINLSSENTDTTEIPKSLTAVTPIPAGYNPKTRVFELQSMGLSGTINGKSFDMSRIDEEVKLNETEIWIIRNQGGMMQAGGHPFHVHGTQFQVISRNGQAPPLQERGFKDTVFVNVGEEVAIRVRFSHPGVFMYHCHILEHEDNGMMGQFRVS